MDLMYFLCLVFKMSFNLRNCVCAITVSMPPHGLRSTQGCYLVQFHQFRQFFLSSSDHLLLRQNVSITASTRQHHPRTWTHRLHTQTSRRNLRHQKGRQEVRR